MKSNGKRSTEHMHPETDTRVIPQISYKMARFCQFALYEKSKMYIL